VRRLFHNVRAVDAHRQRRVLFAVKSNFVSLRFNMNTRTQSQLGLYDSLMRKQRKHEAMVRKVEKANDRLERRRAKLVAMETRNSALATRHTVPRTSNVR